MHSLYTMRLKFLYYIAMVCLCYSCSYKQQHLLFQEKPPVQVNHTIPQPGTPPIYHIKPGDDLQIRNLQNDKAFADNAGATGQTAMPQVFQVEEDGTVTLPVLGHVPVAGLTRFTAARKIEALYRDSLLKNPIFELKVLNLKVTVFGEVKSPGNFVLERDNVTLIDIIGQGGGLTTAADEKNVRIIRKINNVPEVIPIDLSDINILADPRIYLQPNDVISIAQNKRAVRDDKLQNFTTLIQPSVLIFNTALIIYSLFR